MAKRSRSFALSKRFIIFASVAAVLSVVLIAGCSASMTSRQPAKMILPHKPAATPAETESVVLTGNGEAVPVRKAAEAAANQVSNAAIQSQIETENAAAAESADFEVLERGMENEGVSELQSMLLDLGYLDRVTGFYGGDTTQAVRDFQSANGLEADGVVGSKTWELIQASSAE